MPHTHYEAAIAALRVAIRAVDDTETTENYAAEEVYSKRRCDRLESISADLTGILSEIVELQRESRKAREEK